MTNKTCILVDTCVLLEDPDVLSRIGQRGGLPFLTSTVLDELDFNKDAHKRVRKPVSKVEEDRVAQNASNARLIFREFNRRPPIKMNALPTGAQLLGSDVLTQFSFGDTPVFLVGRSSFQSQSNNDAKIIELAQDYRMLLLTRDAGMRVRAEALGVLATFWTGPDESKQVLNRQNPTERRSNNPNRVIDQPATAPNYIKPFLLLTNPINEVDTLSSVRTIPTAGDRVRLGSGYEFRLGKLISAGGEGSIFETQLAEQVCKIYHKSNLTKLKQKKIELMVSRKIVRPGICWPTEIVTNISGEFIGYLMPRAKGTTLQSAIFVKPKFEKQFPNWTRNDLVCVAGTFIDHICFLHSLNIIVGDINPMNLMVGEDSTKVWMVDTDSFQIEGFPCPVGTVNFTPPEIQGQNYSTFLRTKDHELFAIATMIFMILLPGKPPYSQQGGGSPAENIKLKNFPYRFVRKGEKDKTEFTGKNAPQGSWQYIWSHLPYNLREAFFEAFREDKRISTDKWIYLLLNYSNSLDRGFLSNELFPLEFRFSDPIQTVCAKCSTTFTASKWHIEKLSSNNRPVWCPKCANRNRIERMAAQSRHTTEDITGKPAFSTNRIPSSITGKTPAIPGNTSHIAKSVNPTPGTGYISQSNGTSPKIKKTGFFSALFEIIRSI